MKVRIFNYGNYSSSNYGSCRAVEIGDLTLWGASATTKEGSPQSLHV